jgi:phosphate:Na+ symporter
MLRVCEDMFGQLTEVLKNPDEKLGKVIEQVRRMEQKTDDMEEELIEFCSTLAQHDTTARVTRQIARYLEMANDIERVGDHCMNLLLLAERRFDKKLKFVEETQAALEEMLASVAEFLETTRESLDPGGGATSIGDAKVLEARINKLRNSSRKSHSRRMQAGDVNVRVGLIFLDMMTNMEKIGDYCWNVCALQEYAEGG